MGEEFPQWPHLMAVVKDLLVILIWLIRNILPNAVLSSDEAKVIDDLYYRKKRG
jgi:hypothetical protein